MVMGIAVLHSTPGPTYRLPEDVEKDRKMPVLWKEETADWNRWNYSVEVLAGEKIAGVSRW
jgi:hypothetical protein